MVYETVDRQVDLLTRIKKTTKSRYHASSRLSFHHKLSQWIIAFISCGLIYISIAQIVGVDSQISAKELNLMQVTLAILILVYSLLLGQGNFISRSKDMYQNGVELGRLARKVEGHDGKMCNEKYESFIEEYYAVIDKYENHSDVDYQRTMLRYCKKYSFEYFKIFVFFVFLYVLNFSVYIYPLVIMFFCFNYIY
ncbi:MAG: SLATT domain-containing protein [Methylocystaceae bacterium]|nr:SLATT domain-containing protein [Methylocystaceae bacterium]